MLLVGILIQQISTWLQPYANSLGGSTIGKLLSLFVGVLIFTFGCALYMATDQGESPMMRLRQPSVNKPTNLTLLFESTRFVGPIMALLLVVQLGLVQLFVHLVLAHLLVSGTSYFNL